MKHVCCTDQPDEFPANQAFVVYQPKKAPHILFRSG